MENRVRLVDSPWLFSYAEECKNIEQISDGSRIPVKIVMVKKINNVHKKDGKQGDKDNTTVKDNEQNNEQEKKAKDETIKECEPGIYVAKLNILRLFDESKSQSKNFVLYHIFNEPFNIIQIWIKDKENLAYTLSQNSQGDQFIWVWNFK